MAIATGSHLDPYEILSLLGAGGMGELEAFWPAITLGGSRQPKSRAPAGPGQTPRGICC
jgi:hypothetical protein